MPPILKFHVTCCAVGLAMGVEIPLFGTAQPVRVAAGTRSS